MALPWFFHGFPHQTSLRDEKNGGFLSGWRRPASSRGDSAGWFFDIFIGTGLDPHGPQDFDREWLDGFRSFPLWYTMHIQKSLWSWNMACWIICKISFDDFARNLHGFAFPATFDTGGYHYSLRIIPLCSTHVQIIYSYHWSTISPSASVFFPSFPLWIPVLEVSNP